MKKTLALVAAAALVLLMVPVCAFASGVQVADANASNRSTSACPGYTDKNSNGVCDNYEAGTCPGTGGCAGQGYVDADNNGVCDNYEQGACPGSGQGYVDTDDNGVCDNYEQGACPGSGQGQGQGYGHHNGCGQGYGHGGCARGR